jgi:predicted tellurium resistance membrane protein TerC
MLLGIMAMFAIRLFHLMKNLMVMNIARLVLMILFIFVLWRPLQMFIEGMITLMMRKEIKRIQKMVNKYKTGIVEEYSKEEAAEILKSYMDKESINNYLETMYPKKEVHEDIKIYKRTK